MPTTAAALPVLARVFPPGCSYPGCAHHCYRPSPDCVCVAWPDGRGGSHLFAVNELCPVHHTVMELIEDAAADLEMRGYLDPDEEEIPTEIVAVLLELYLAGECNLCPGWPGPSNLAEHLIARWQIEYEQSLTVWPCACGARYKLLTEYDGPEQYYQVADDETLGGLAGVVKRNSKGKVKHSDVCPACGREFAQTGADRSAPQRPLFDATEVTGGPHAPAKAAWPSRPQSTAQVVVQDALF
jgi:hypothetical protein